MVTKDLGMVTAYAYAVAGGYTGTEEEFTQLMASLADEVSRIENLSVTVTTLPAGSQATASLNGSVLSLGIPRGDKGEKGDKGDKGDTGEVSQAEFDEAVSDLKSEITATQNNEPITLYKGSPSGTQYVDVDVTIPQGAYNFKCSSITSAGTDSSFSRVVFFSSDMAQYLQIDLPRNVEIDEPFETSFDTAHIYFYAEQGYPQSAGDTFSFSNAKITQETVLNKKMAEVDAHNEAFSDLGLYKQVGRNLLDPNEVIFNATLNVTTGAVESYNGNIVTGFMPVEEGLTYSCFATSGGIIGLPVNKVIAYNSDKTFNSNLGSLAYAGTYPNVVTIPANAKYIRMDIGESNYTSFGTVMVAQSARSSMPPIIEPFTASDALSKEVRKWHGELWAAIGDSLTEVNAKTTKNYCDYISEATGITVANMGVSGTGYMKFHDVSNAFYDRVANVPQDADVVTIFGSLNDIGQPLGTVEDDVSDNTVFGFVNGTIDALYTALPTVNLGIISPTPWNTSEPWNENNEATKYCEGLKQICYNRGIPFLDLYHCSNLRPWDSTARTLFYSRDGGSGTHPDERGHAMIAPKIKAFLESLLI